MLILFKRNVNSLLYLLSRIKPFISIPMRKLFFNTYILAHLDYCCIIWGNCNLSQEEKLIQFQKRATRLILDEDYITSLKEGLFNDLNWLTFRERITFRKLYYCIKYLMFCLQSTWKIYSRLPVMSMIERWDLHLMFSSTHQDQIPNCFENRFCILDHLFRTAFHIM